MHTYGGVDQYTASGISGLIIYLIRYIVKVKMTKKGGGKLSNFNENLKRIRTEKKITQASMAKALKIQQPNYGLYEQGKREMTVCRLKEICQILHVSADELLGLKDPPSPPEGGEDQTR